MLFALACTAGYFWATYAVPETGGRALEEVDAVFGSRAGADDVRLRHEVRSLQERYF